MKKIDNIFWKMDPLDHQKRIVSQSLECFEKNGFAAYFCEVGTRKTSMAITSAINLAYKGLIDSIIIICPNPLFENWVNELSLHADLPENPFRWDTVNPKTNKGQTEVKRLINGKLPVSIINYDAFSRPNDTLHDIIEKISKRKSFIIMDESHKIKQPSSERTKQIIKISNKFDYKLIMTGTEIPSGISNIWSQFEALKSHFWRDNADIGNYSCFRAKYEIMGQIKLNNGMYKEVPKRVKYMRDFELERYNRGLDQINKIIEPYTFRAKRAECFDLPDFQINYIDFDLSKEERKVYDEMKNDLMTKIGEEFVAVDNPVTLFIRFRQIVRGFMGQRINDQKRSIIHTITENPSALNALCEHVDSHDENEIIFCNFTHDVELTYKTLQQFGETVCVYGEQSQEKNQAAIKAFSNGGARFITGNMRMLSAGHNFQNHCNMTFVYSPDTDNEAWGQHEGRVYRSGQKNKMYFNRLRAKNTIDRRIYEILEGNKNTQDFFANLSMNDLIEML